MSIEKTCDEIRCEFSLPYCIRVPEEDIHFPYKDIQCNLRFRRVVRAESGENLVPGILDGQLDVITCERFGRYDFSSVSMVMRKTYFDYEPAMDADKIFTLALMVLNRFLEFYRRTYDEYWLIQITERDILHWNLGCYLDGVNVPGLTSKIGGGGTVILPWRSYIDQKSWERSDLYAKLQGNYDLPLYIRTLMEGTRLAMSGAPDIAVIMFDRSFELYFDLLVSIWMQKRKLDQADWASYIKRDLVGRERRPSSSKLLGYSEKISSSGRKFWTGEPSYDNWKKNCRDIRNDIAHGRRSEITVIEAIGVRHAVWQAFEFFGYSHIDEVVISDQYTNSQKLVRPVPVKFCTE